MEVLLLIIGGAVVSAITQLAKKAGMAPQLALALLAIGFGTIYFIAQTLFPPATWETVVNSILSIAGTATLIYNFLIKKLQ
jgi:hypothetical protein